MSECNEARLAMSGRTRARKEAQQARRESTAKSAHACVGRGGEVETGERRGGKRDDA